jgi:hypothetical protein
VRPWHTADGDPEGERALEEHLLDPEAIAMTLRSALDPNPITIHAYVSEHDGLPPHQHAFVLPRPSAPPEPPGPTT